MRAESLREAFGRGPLIGDAGLGARLFEVAQALPTPPAFLELWNREAPLKIEELHALDLAAGAELIVTNSFRADALSLATSGLASDSQELARLGAEIACSAANAQSPPRAFVLGSLGPGPGTADEQASFSEHIDAARGLLEGGVDALLVETVRHSKRAAAVIEAACRARAELHREEAPLLLSLTPDASGILADGASMEEVIEPAWKSIDGLGLNCVPLDEAGLALLLERLSKFDLPLFLAPNPAPGEAQADAFASSLHRLAVRHDLAFVRGCCGSNDQHVSRLRSLFRP